MRKQRAEPESKLGSKPWRVLLLVYFCQLKPSIEKGTIEPLVRVSSEGTSIPRPRHNILLKHPKVQKTVLTLVETLGITCPKFSIYGVGGNEGMVQGIQERSLSVQGAALPTNPSARGVFSQTSRALDGFILAAFWALKKVVRRSRKGKEGDIKQ